LSHEHLEGAVKNLLAFENHASSDGCPHCMTKHLLITEELLEEENQQRKEDGFTDLIARVKDLRKLKLPKAYDGEFIKGPDMELVSKEARGIRLEVMKRAGLPMHTEHMNPKNAHPHVTPHVHEEKEHLVVG
jgi:hypothetical protein